MSSNDRPSSPLHLPLHADAASPAEEGCSRRAFLRGCGLLALGAAAPLSLVGCSSGPVNPTPCGPNSVGVGLLDSVQQGSALLIESLSVFLCRDQAGYFAVDAECTHIGTMVEWSQGASKFECPLHGATYSLDGANLTGPATIPLKHYSLCVTASGSLVVDTSLEVPAATRLKA